MVEEKSKGSAPDTWGDLNTVLYGVIESLRIDVEFYWDRVLAEQDNVFWRRGLVRATFAFFEGMISTLKGEALALHVFLQRKLSKEPIPPSEDPSEDGILRNYLKHVDRVRRGADFEPWELLLIQELSYELTDAGEIKWKKAKLRLDSNLVFCFRMLAKAARVEFKLPRDGKGWNDFKSSIRIRDRLTHPRRSRDIEISTSEVETVLRAFYWIHEQRLALRQIIAHANNPPEPTEANGN